MAINNANGWLMLIFQYATSGIQRPVMRQCLRSHIKKMLNTLQSQTPNRCNITGIVLLVLIIPLRCMALDMEQLRLAMPINDQRCKSLAAHTPRVKAVRVLLYIQPPLSIVSVDYGRPVALGKFLLAVVPELFPGRAGVFGAGDARFEVDGAHVHDVEGVLVLERYIGYEAGVDGDEGAEVGDVADAEDDGAMLHVGDFFFGELFGKRAELVVAVGCGGGGGGGGGGGVVVGDG